MKKILTLSLIGLVCASGAAYAEMVQGMITRIDQSNSLISIRQIGTPVKNTQEQLDVRFRPNTKTKNVESVQDLAVGQQVKVDVKQDKAANMMEAKSIEVTGPSAAAAGLATEQQRADLANRDLDARPIGSDADLNSNPSAIPASQGVPSAGESTSVTGHNAERGALAGGSASDSGY